MECPTRSEDIPSSVYCEYSMICRSCAWCLGVVGARQATARGTGYPGTCTCTRITFCAITFCQYFSKNVWQRRRIDNSVGFRYFWQMCSFQTSTGTRLSHRVDENTGATAEDDELLLVFWRLAGGAVGPPTFPFRVKQGDVVSRVFIFWPPENLTPTFKFSLLLTLTAVCSTVICARPISNALARRLVECAVVHIGCVRNFCETYFL